MLFVDLKGTMGMLTYATYREEVKRMGGLPWR